MTADPRVEAVAEWLYERDWRGRRWPGEEAMRDRPTFAQLLTGETCKPESYAHLEVAEGERRLKEAAALLAVIGGEAYVRERIAQEIEAAVFASGNSGLWRLGMTEAARIARGNK